MQIHELIVIFLVGAGLGVIARYIVGYRKKYAPYVACNILLGAVACVVSHFLWGSNTYSVFFSGVGGVVFNLLFCIYRLFGS